MKNRLSVYAATAVIFVALCGSAFAGSIPTVPAPTGEPLASAQPTPTPEQTTQSSQTTEEGLLDWLLGLLTGE
jgi:hypothetical protein